MTLTNSSTRVALLVAGVAVAIGLMGAVAVAPAQAQSALTAAQVQAIVSLLASFGADQATINNVTAALNGQATPGTGGSTGGTGGACPALSRDLQQGSTGADVMALQKFLNGSADTRVSASGAGSPGNETSTFGPATKAAVIKFQTKYNVTPIAGYVGAKTRAQIAAVCGGVVTPGPGTGTSGSVMVSAAAQPVNSLAPQGASRVPFTTFTLTNNSGAPVTINSVTVERTGLGVDANFSGIVLLDSNGLQIGTAKTLNSNHQANLGDSGFTIGAGQSVTYTVAGNIATGQSTNGQVVSLKVVAVNTGATVGGSLPISGASQTINNTLTLGSVSTTTSGFDPGAAQTRNIGDVAVRFSGIKFQAGSTEDLKLYSIRWRQVGSGSSADLANVVTVAGGTSYPTTVDASGKYYTTIFPGGLLITKGNTVDVYVQGDIVGSNSASRTIDFDIDKVTDVYFIGQLYGYGVAPSGTFTPWFSGYVTTVAGGTVTTISKANSGKAAAQNIAINVPNQPLGGFTTNFAGEAISVQSLIFTVATSTASTGLLTNVSITDSNGTVVAGPVDATWASGTQTLTFTDTVTFPTGSHTYYLQGKVPSTATGGAGIAISTTVNSSNWTNATGQTTGNTISLPGTSLTMNTMTVKGGELLVSMDTQPASQTIVAGSSNFTFANVNLNAQNSGEDLRLSSLPITFAGNAANLTGCQLWDGTTALNTSSRVVNSVSSGVKNTFSFDNVLRVPKGTTKKLAVACNLSSAATSSSTYLWSTDTVTGDYSVTGDVSGVTITPTITSSNGGTMTVGTASLAFTVHNSSPASTTVSGGSTGQTVAVYNLRATNDTITLTKLGVALTSGTSASVVNVSLYNAAGTLIGTAQFGSGQTEATSTLTTPLNLPADTDVRVTAKADFADVGTGKSGVSGAVVQINPSSAEGNSTTGLAQATGSGSTAGVRLYNSFPTITYSTTGATLVNGVNDLVTFTVAADAAGDVGLFKLTFNVSTTTVSLTAPTVSGPNGNVASTTNVVLNTAGTAIIVYFDSTSNTADSVVGGGSSKTYTLRGTVTGLTGSNSGSVSISLDADTGASAIAKAASVSPSSMIWSPLSTTSIERNTNDWTNGYALKGCFADAGLGNDCTTRVLSSN
jgi:hypothetical protein